MEVDVDGDDSTENSLSQTSDSFDAAEEKKKIAIKEDAETPQDSNDVTRNKPCSISESVKPVTRTCYSPACRAGGGKCYSQSCKYFLSCRAQTVKSTAAVRQEDSNKESLKTLTKSTALKVYLPKIAKVGRGHKKRRMPALPVSHRFLTGSSAQSLLVLPHVHLRKLSRKAAQHEVPGFNYNARTVGVNWPYPCPRPNFKTAWRYRTMTLKSLGCFALEMRIFWTCIRWDDIQAKPPADGNNTVTTETEVTTTELLKKRDVGLYKLRSQYLTRRIVVPIVDEVVTIHRGKPDFYPVLCCCISFSK